MPAPRPTRLPLSGASPRRLPFERRLRLWLLLLTLPTVPLACALTWQLTHALSLALLTAAGLALAALIAAAAFFEQVTRPLQTLSNVVAALREDDFSFRARGARRNDSLGDLALEINALAATLQNQRTSALDALSLVQRVLTSMSSPVLAFDSAHRLRLLNPAATEAFALHRQRSLGQHASELHLHTLLDVTDQAVYIFPTAAIPTAPPVTLADPTRWSVRRSTFRLHGIPHTLFVLADVSSALREEERLAFQRLIRVLGHEINNSLTPIKSIAGSLRTHLPTLAPLPHPGPNLTHLDRGLAIIEDRADSLNRFLQAYQRLSRLPPPALQPTPLAPLAQRVAALETRLPIRLLPSPILTVLADPDQLEQLLINLLRNAVDAALQSAQSPLSPRPEPHQSAGAAEPPTSPEVTLAWTATPVAATLFILDNGPGLTNPANLFVPFYTTKSNGSGIGLVLAQQIVSAHGGTLNLTNRPAQPGCQAEIRIPLAVPYKLPHTVA